MTVLVSQIRRRKRLPSKEILDSIFSYDANLGVLFWKNRPRSHFKCEQAYKQFHKLFSGKMAGYYNSPLFYYKVYVLGSLFLGSHVIWAMASGPVPDDMVIDHINGNPRDNRLENLRLVSYCDNSKNTAISSRNRSGVSGVYWDSSHAKWQARVYVEKKAYNLGRYDSVSSAKLVVDEFRKKNGFSCRHGA